MDAKISIQRCKTGYKRLLCKLFGHKFTQVELLIFADCYGFRGPLTKRP